MRAPHPAQAAEILGMIAKMNIAASARDALTNCRFERMFVGVVNAAGGAQAA